MKTHEFAAVETDEIYQERAKAIINLVLDRGISGSPVEAVVGLLKKADALRSGTVAQRLASLILEIGADAPEKTILFSQEKMADAVGASRSFVSTILNEWKRDGLVSGLGRKLRLDSISKLTKLAKG